MFFHRSIWPLPPPKRAQGLPLSGSSASTRPSAVGMNSLAAQAPSAERLGDGAAAGGGWYERPRQVRCCSASEGAIFGVWRHSSWPVVALSATTDWCGVQRNSRSPTFSGVTSKVVSSGSPGWPRTSPVR